MKKIYFTLLGVFISGIACYAQNQVFHLNGGQSWGNVVTLATDNTGGADDARLLLSYRNGSKRWAIGGQNNTTRFSIWEDAGDGVYSSGWGNERFTVNAGGNIGIGTSYATSKLTVNAGENNKSIEISGNNFFQSPDAHNFPALSFYSTQSTVRQPSASAEMVFSDRPGTAGYPQNARASDILFYTAHSYDGASNSYGVFPDLTMVVKSTQDGGAVGIGTANPDIAYKLSVNGNIRSKEVKVETGWADYVFKKDYQLKPLSEVEAYIAKNSHLPDVPSEAEVKKNGVNVGETESLLLKKIEELTLYLIEKDKEVRALKLKVENGDKEVKELTLQSEKSAGLESRLSRLEALLAKPAAKN